MDKRRADGKLKQGQKKGNLKKRFGQIRLLQVEELELNHTNVVKQ